MKGAAADAEIATPFILLLVSFAVGLSYRGANEVATLMALTVLAPEFINEGANGGGGNGGGGSNGGGSDEGGGTRRGGGTIGGSNGDVLLEHPFKSGVRSRFTLEKALASTLESGCGLTEASLELGE